jgi:hypothetical protein
VEPNLNINAFLAVETLVISGVSVFSFEHELNKTAASATADNSFFMVFDFIVTTKIIC